MSKRRRAARPRQSAAPAAGQRPAGPWPAGTAAAAVALTGLTLFVYLPVRHFAFVNWDDPSYLTDNAQVQAGLSWPNVLWALTTTHSPYWHPLTWLSHMLDVTLFGMDPGAHHVTSLVLHALNTVLVFLVLRRMTGAAGPSAFVAAIFGVHPLHVESVAWLAERKDVLSTCFLLLTIGAYLRYVDRPTAPRYALIIACYALALMSKPMVVTLPLVLLLLDAWPLARFRSESAGRLVTEKLPLFAMAAATAVATVIVQRRVGAVAALSALPLRPRLANAIVSGVEYVWKAIWPAHLAPFYPLQLHPAWMVVAAGIMLVAATLLAWRARTRYPFIFVGWSWYLATIAPVTGLIQAGQQGIADRFMYVPLVGLSIIVAWSAARVRAPAIRWSAAAAVVLALAVAARAQVWSWSDSTALWEHAISVTFPNSVSYEKLGDALRERGDLDDAQGRYQTALQLTQAGDVGERAIILNSLGLTLIDRGKLDEASRAFIEAVRLNPAFAEAQTNAANTLAGEGQYAEAIQRYRAALELAPTMTDAHVGLAAALVSFGKPADAVPHYRQALAADPSLAQAHSGLGGALTLLGDDAQAMSELTRALALRPDLPSAHVNMAVLLVHQGRTTEARQHLETALQIDPGYEPARRALAQLR